MSHQVYPSKWFCLVFPSINTANFLFLFHGSVFKYIMVPLLTGLNHILPVCPTDLGNWASSKCIFKMYLAQFSEIFRFCFRHCHLRYPSFLHLQWKLEPDSGRLFYKSCYTALLAKTLMISQNQSHMYFTTSKLLHNAMGIGLLYLLEFWNKEPDLTFLRMSLPWFTSVP